LVVRILGLLRLSLRETRKGELAVQAGNEDNVTIVLKLVVATNDLGSARRLSFGRVMFVCGVKFRTQDEDRK
jgi:hypothetical protein